MVNQDIIEQFAKLAPCLERARIAVSKEIEQLLITDEIKLQLISSRVKDTQSLAAKIARPDKTYENLWDVTDLFDVGMLVYSLAAGPSLKMKVTTLITPLGLSWSLKNSSLCGGV